MKKTHFYLLGFLFLFACSTSKKTVTTDIKIEPPYTVVGDFDYPHFSDTTHWATNINEQYQTMSNNIEILKIKLEDVSFKVYAGTWCGDSKRHVPIFLKVLKEADFPFDHIEFHLLDQHKKDKTGLAVKDNILLVPTFIAYRNNKEIGRIVETPNTTIEQDLVEMVMNE